MTIKKNGLVFNLAYKHPFIKKIPERTSLCKLFWCTVLGLFVAWPACIIITLAVLVIVAVVAPLCGYWFNFTMGAGESPFKPLWRLNRFPPVLWAAIVWSTYSIYTTSRIGFNEVYPTGAEKGAIITTIVLIAIVVFAICLLLIGLTIGAKCAIGKNELVGVVRGYIKTCKDKVCPLVEFKD